MCDQLCDPARIEIYTYLNGWYTVLPSGPIDVVYVIEPGTIGDDAPGAGE